MNQTAWTLNSQIQTTTGGHLKGEELVTGRIVVFLIRKIPGQPELNLTISVKSFMTYMNRRRALNTSEIFGLFFGLNVLFEKDFTCLHLDYQLQLSEEHMLRRFW